ncbi:uncharacterized protein LY79DRAFT_176688 [Colletotrichum navitas]|uniref:Uncharacterized protein n=1 Tax=Colletotrichum navitas TaxID=681940 RepID=A0AAD8Q1S8_9PEZI|nr:uncharacterized protein LY79DRAFT_176688 [Colletotrichum navitas]KAK1593667.1 hypothetical protein LY79DRAFT_176688 [Colletotrichum navitas]
MAQPSSGTTASTLDADYFLHAAYYSGLLALLCLAFLGRVSSPDPSALDKPGANRDFLQGNAAMRARPTDLGASDRLSSLFYSTNLVQRLNSLRAAAKKKMDSGTKQVPSRETDDNDDEAWRRLGNQLPILRGQGSDVFLSLLDLHTRQVSPCFQGSRKTVRRVRRPRCRAGSHTHGPECDGQNVFQPRCISLLTPPHPPPFTSPRLNSPLPSATCR